MLLLSYIAVSTFKHARYPRPLFLYPLHSRPSPHIRLGSIFPHLLTFRGLQLPFHLVTVHIKDSGAAFTSVFYSPHLLPYSPFTLTPTCPPVYKPVGAFTSLTRYTIVVCLSVRLLPTRVILCHFSSFSFPHFPSLQCLTEVCVVRTYTTYGLTPHQLPLIPQNYAYPRYTLPSFSFLDLLGLSFPFLLSYLLVFK